MITERTGLPLPGCDDIEFLLGLAWRRADVIRDEAVHDPRPCGPCGMGEGVLSI